MDTYNKDLTSIFLMYLDANNLYGWPMCKKLPLKGFNWAKNLDRYTPEFIKNYDDNSNLGYLLEVDIAYPKNLQKAHSDLPFLPERRKKLNASKYSKAIQKERKNNPSFLPDQKNKLVTTLYDKQTYVAQMSTLKQALNHGLISTKVHRVIRFV